MIESPTPKESPGSKKGTKPKEKQTKQHSESIDYKEPKVEVDEFNELTQLRITKNLFGHQVKEEIKDSFSARLKSEDRSHFPATQGTTLAAPKAANFNKGESDMSGKEGRRQYKFAWNKDDDGELSDVTISSIHTSDLSSLSNFSESSEEEGEISDKDEGEFCWNDFHCDIGFTCLNLSGLLD